MHTPSIAVSAIQDNKRLAAANRRLAQSRARLVRLARMRHGLNREVKRNRETIAAQGLRIQTLERELAELCNHLKDANRAALGNELTYGDYYLTVKSALAPAEQLVSVNA